MSGNATTQSRTLQGERGPLFPKTIAMLARWKIITNVGDFLANFGDEGRTGTREFSWGTRAPGASAGASGKWGKPHCSCCLSVQSPTFHSALGPGSPPGCLSRDRFNPTGLWGLQAPHPAARTPRLKPTAGLTGTWPQLGPSSPALSTSAHPSSPGPEAPPCLLPCKTSRVLTLFDLEPPLCLSSR